MRSRKDLRRGGGAALRPLANKHGDLRHEAARFRPPWPKNPNGFQKVDAVCFPPHYLPTIMATETCQNCANGSAHDFEMQIWADEQQTRPSSRHLRSQSL